MRNTVLQLGNRCQIHWMRVFFFLDEGPYDDSDLEFEDDEVEEDELKELTTEAELFWFNSILAEAQAVTIQAEKEAVGVCQVGVVRGNPGVQNLNPYPTLHKPLPLVKGKGFEGSGSGFCLKCSI